jgi:putative ABC transport system permease protein
VRSVRAFLIRLAASLTGSRREGDFHEELQSHLQLHIDDGIRAGLTPAEARRDAMLKLGGVTQTIERQRDRRGLPSLDGLVRDFRHAVRVLLHMPGFTAAALIVLALGIGANTAIFSIVNTVLLRPLPFADADRIMRIWHTPPPELFPGMTTFSVSPANYLDWRARNHSFEAMAVYAGRPMNFTGNGEPQSIRTTQVSSNYWNLLGVSARLGRTFLPGEDEEGRNRVVLLSDAFWRSHFGGRADVVNSTIHLDGHVYTIVGVMPPGTAYPFTAQAWVPLAFSASERSVRGIHNYVVLGRLKRDVSREQAQADMTQLSAQLEAEYPTDNKGWGATVKPFHDDIVRDVRRSLLVLLGAVALVLLIACANLANLLLAKTLARGREIAIRTALGASRGRVVQQALCETVLLALVGGVAGLLFAEASLDAMVNVVRSQLPRAADIAIDPVVLGFALALSIITGIAAGILPAWRMTQGNLHEALKLGQARGNSASGERRTRGVLVVSEVALALVLLIGAGLLIRSLAALQRVDPGFDPRGIMTMTTWLPPAKYDDDAKRVRFVDELLTRMRTIPGVESVGATDSLPLTGGSTEPVAIDGRPAVALSEQPEVAVRMITPGYLETIRLHLMSGRDFDPSDVASRPKVVLISESMALRFWPGLNPIGQHLTLTFYPGITREVVGVVADMKLLGLDVRDPVAAVYVPLAQVPRPVLSLAVRTAVPPTEVATLLTAAVRAVDAEQPVLALQPMDSVVGESMAQQRFSMFLLTAFAVVALLLAAVGIYSVLAYTVRQRVREIGIRMALGASARGVLGSILVEGLRPTFLGIALGLAGAVAIGRALSTLLFGITPYDVVTFVSVAAGVVAVGIVASVLPAYRATRVDPMVALRCD